MASEFVYLGTVESPTLTFDNSNIDSINCDNSVDLIGDKLSTDTIEVTVFFSDSDSVLRNLPYATPLYYYTNGQLVGKYYVNKIDRQGSSLYQISGTSLIGLLEEENFYGGFYSATPFDTVLKDVLFTNGNNGSTYKVYKPQGKTGQTNVGVIVGTESASSKFWKYRLHSEFTLVDPNPQDSSWTSGFDTVLGTYDRYYVRLIWERADTSSPFYWIISLYYGGLYIRAGYDTPLIGNGSHVTLDINPMEGKMSLIVDYVKYDDTSTTGTITVNGSITASTATTAINLGCAFGGVHRTNINTASSFRERLRWDNYRVYDPDGNLYIDAIYAVRESDSQGFVVDAMSGNSASTNNFDAYGTALAEIGDFARVYRDIELYNSIVYGEGVSTIPVYGWIDICSKREALHQLLFSQNVSLLKSSTGQFLFTTLSDMEAASISNDNVYNNTSSGNVKIAKKIVVTEHSYEQSGETKTLFDNTTSELPSGEYVAEFKDAPIYGTPVGNGITIISYNCNAAIVTGRGTITGTPYNHSKNKIQYINPSTRDGSDISVNSIGLITGINSDKVMSKLQAYYSGGVEKIKQSIVYSGEKCGLKYLFDSMFGSANSGFLVKFSARSSAIVKADCEIITGFSPTSSGGYTGYTIQLSGDTWEVPASVRSSDSPYIRLNIIGKGYDGTDGADGSNGTFASEGTGALPGGAGGDGGSGGTGGLGGYIYVVTVDVTNVHHIVVSDSGNNIIVKTYNSSNTLLNTYNSSTGNQSDSGFMNVFTGVMYALPGNDGYDGAKGGTGGYMDGDGETIVAPTNGEDAYGNLGGTSQACIVKTYAAIGGTATMYNNFGGGGGAAYGANGNDSFIDVDFGEIVLTKSGRGADAGAAVVEHNTYGCGGAGGNGGGGSGGAGARYSVFPGEHDTTYTTHTMHVGRGGYGSVGTSGIQGCVIVYY